MNKIIEVLMNRDGMTKAEAEKHFKYVKGLIEEAAERGSYEEAEEIMSSELGLEIDYIFDILL